MIKKFKRAMALVLICLFCTMGFAGCSLFEFEEYVPNYFEEGYVEPDYNFAVACTKEQTTITIGDVGEYGEFANVVYAKPYQYLGDESSKGVAEEKDSKPTNIGKYECGTEATVTIDRYDVDGYDTVYCKFYVINDEGHILAGPVYATEIQPEFSHEQIVTAKGIKGVKTIGGSLDYVKDLGCEHAQIDCYMGGVIVPLETVDETTGQITPINYTEELDENGRGFITGPQGGRQEVEAFWHNGKKYYFRIGNWGGYANLAYYDSEILSYTNAKVKVTLLLLEQINTNQYIQPYFLTYKEARYKPAGFYAINTANPYGAEYWAAFTEFIARRYSSPNAEHGAVEVYVLGNEIDQCMQWNCMRDLEKYARLSTEDYGTEYERMMRIANQSFKKVYANNVPLVPFTHWWNANGGGSDYNPKAIFDYLCARTRSQGNYNWGLAIHPYGATLSVTNFWSNDLASTSDINGKLDTRRITWTNLEVLQLYLEQELKMCNGKVRDVYVTEGGVSTSATPADGNMNTLDKAQQAAGIAYAYYKASQLSCIKALNYYRITDAPEEGARFGLMTENYLYKKPSYYLYKEIDTEKSWEATDKYLQYITWTIFEDGRYTPHGYGVDFDFSWQKAMRIVKSDFDWESHWDTAKIITRSAT